MWLITLTNVHFILYGISIFPVSSVKIVIAEIIVAVVGEFHPDATLQDSRDDRRIVTGLSGRRTTLSNDHN